MNVHWSPDICPNGAKISVGPTNVYATQDMKWIQLGKTVLVRSFTVF